jgi:hypothetical protein
MAKVYKCMNNEEHLFEVPTPDFYCNICPPYSSMLVQAEIQEKVKPVSVVAPKEEIAVKFNSNDLKKYFSPIQGFRYGDKMKETELNSIKLFLSQIYPAEYVEVENMQVILYYDNSYKLGEKSGILLLTDNNGSINFLIFDNKLGILLFDLNENKNDSLLTDILLEKGILQIKYKQADKDKSKTFAGFQKLVSESVIKFIKEYRDGN